MLCPDAKRFGMQKDAIREEMVQILAGLAKRAEISCFIDATLQCPEPHRGFGDIRVMILGQDPTVKNAKSREKIKTVLNLDKPGSLFNYVSKIAKAFGTTVNENVYATNMVKNFLYYAAYSIQKGQRSIRMCHILACSPTAKA